MEDPLLTKSEHIINITSDGQAPHEVFESSDPYTVPSVRNSIEFVMNLVQIVAAIVVLTQPKDKDHPQIILFIWIIGYTFGCLVSLPILCWRFWYYNQSVSFEPTEENSIRTRINEVMDRLHMLLDVFFVAWFMVFFWNFLVNVSSLDDTTTQFLWLCAALLTFSCIRYVFINLTYAIICCFLPVHLCVLAIVEVTKVIIRLAVGICICLC